MRLLLRGLTVSIALWMALPAQAQQPTQNQIQKMVEALRQAAPNTGSQNDGLYSDWKVTAGIIPDWSRRCLGSSLTPEQFGANPQAARSIVTCITRRELTKQLKVTGNNETAAVRRYACWWMTGTETGCNSGATATYVQKVLSYYGTSTH